MTNTSKDYYRLLGISPAATTAELRSAYRKLALQHHPDRNPGDPGAEERFKQINAAYQVLSDPVERAAYDRRAPHPAASQPESQPHPAASRPENRPRPAASAAKPEPLAPVPAWIWLAAGTVLVVLVAVVSGLVFWQNYSRTHFLPAHIAMAPTRRFQDITAIPYRSPVPSPSPTINTTTTPTPTLQALAEPLPQTGSPLAAGGEHTCVLTSAGGVKCWGSHYMLGDGKNEKDALAPVDVSGLRSGVVAITAGTYHTCALLESGGVKCWGLNAHGELGNGSLYPTAVPVDVYGLDTGVVAISAGGEHTCALTNTGAVECWGDNAHHQLGILSQDRLSATPVTVDGLDHGVVAITVGFDHACALMNTGTVKCWPGLVTNETNALVADVRGLGGDVVAIAAGFRHDCALTKAGADLCRGSNGYGQLGNGTHNDNSSPEAVNGLDNGVKAITETCAVLNTGALKCWGSNRDGEVGDGTNQDRTEPVDVSGLTEPVKAVAQSGSHTCALTESDQVYCWGANDQGQLGNGTRLRSLIPAVVLGLGPVVPTPQATAANITATPTPLPAETSTAP